MLLAILVVVCAVAIIWRIEAMTQKLDQAIADMQAEVTDSVGKLASIKAAIEAFPAIVAAAVTDALAANDVAADAAAEAVDAAREAVSNSVDDTLTAIDANPAPDEESPDEE